MQTQTATSAVLRRVVLRVGAWAGLWIAGSGVGMGPKPAAADDTAVHDRALIERLIGRMATESARVLIEMPPVFANGYSVPLELAVDSPMTASDHVRSVLVIAPRNPIVTVANFQFTVESGRAAVSTRIRLSQPQSVFAAAEMSDGSWLMASRWIQVETDGCS